MKIIVCLDDQDGMLFHGRRQSKDRLLRERVLSLTKDSKLWMNGYSASQFSDADRICVSEHFLTEAGDKDYCFVENESVLPVISRIDTVIIYRWNRSYPSNEKFPVSSFADQWKCLSKTDFPGHSHETITEEVFVLE